VLVLVTFHLETARAEKQRDDMPQAYLLVSDYPGCLFKYSLDGNSHREVVVRPELSAPHLLTATGDDWLYYVDDRGNGTRIHRVKLKPPWSDRPEELPLEFDCIKDMVEAPDERLYVLAGCSAWNSLEKRIEVVTGPPWSSQVLAVVEGADPLPDEMVLDTEADRLYYFILDYDQFGVWSVDRFTGSDQRLEFTPEEVGLEGFFRIAVYPQDHQMYVSCRGAVYSVDLLAAPGAHEAQFITEAGPVVNQLVVNPHTGAFCTSVTEGDTQFQCWRLDDLDNPSLIAPLRPAGMALTRDGERLLYPGGSGIESVNVDGTDRTSVLPFSFGRVGSFGIDARRHRIYTTHHAGYLGAHGYGIVRTDFSGSKSEELFSFPDTYEFDEFRVSVNGVVVDSHRRRVYFQVDEYPPSSSDPERVLYGMDLNGHRAGVVATDVNSHPALDELTGRVCWTGQSDIRCMDGHSHTVVPVVDTGDWPQRVGIDSERRIIYWQQPSWDTGPPEFRLYRAELDSGDGQRDITPVDLPEPQRYAGALAVDSVTGRVYVADSTLHGIWSVDQEGEDFRVIADADDGVRTVGRMTVIREVPQRSNGPKAKDGRVRPFRR